MGVVDGSFDHPMKREEEASAPLAGGIMNHGFQCGMLWGGSLAAGAEAYRRFGPGPQAEKATIMATTKLLETFHNRTKNEMNCTEITEINLAENLHLLPILNFLVKGGKVGPGACFRLAAGFAHDASKTIDNALIKDGNLSESETLTFGDPFSEGETLSEEPGETPPPPVSCAAVLARKMGASELHEVMASGFAGGIGLSGGGCGALGAAIWLTALNGRTEGIKKVGYFDDPSYAAVIDKFVECTDCEFECSAIVGRKFEDIDDHAAYLSQGGCAEIIEALAAN